MTVSTQEVENGGSEVQDYPQLLKELKANLGYMGSILKIYFSLKSHTNTHANSWVAGMVQAGHLILVPRPKPLSHETLNSFLT